MSSTNKTTNLKLNDWVGTDVPQREDFNADNQRIDKAIGDHTGNTTVHITQAERDLWGLPFYYYNYFGNGKATRKVEVLCHCVCRRYGALCVQILQQRQLPLCGLCQPDARHHRYDAG